MRYCHGILMAPWCQRFCAKNWIMINHSIGGENHAVLYRSLCISIMASQDKAICKNAHTNLKNVMCKRGDSQFRVVKNWSFNPKYQYFKTQETISIGIWLPRNQTQHNLHWNRAELSLSSHAQLVSNRCFVMATNGHDKTSPCTEDTPFWRTRI